MPDLTADELETLRADIAERGVVVPVVKDQHGRVIDGHNRLAIAADLGIDCPVEIRHVVDDDAARDLALTLNAVRRHLTREGRRDLIRRECERRPEASDREIARLLGCSPSTVAAVRRPVSKLDTSEAYEPPEDVDLEMRERVLAVYDQMNLKPDLPKSDAAERWTRAAFVQDTADPPFSLMLLLALPSTTIDDIELSVAIISRMALWRSVGISRAEVRGSRMMWWLDLVLSPSSRARFQGYEDLRRMWSTVRSDENRDLVLDALRDNLASIPRVPAEIGGASA